MSGGAITQRMIMIAAMAIVVWTLTQLFQTADQQDLRTRAEMQDQLRDRITAMAEKWNRAIAYGATYSALTPMSDTDKLATNVRFDPSDEYWGLPRTEGFENVSLFCGSCHSLAIVMQQRQTPDGWRYLLNWMVDKQGMAPLHNEDRALIHAYLSREFGSE